MATVLEGINSSHPLHLERGGLDGLYFGQDTFSTPDPSRRGEGWMAFVLEETHSQHSVHQEGGGVWMTVVLEGKHSSHQLHVGGEGVDGHCFGRNTFFTPAQP